MGKLHEHIAVENDIKGTLSKIIAEAATTFTKKDTHFDESSRLYTPFVDGDKDIPETEVTHMVTTVKDKLDYVFPYLAKNLDHTYQKELANTVAKADVVLENGTVLAEKVPVLVLVQLENTLEGFRKNVLEIIPTLDPKIDWEPDTSAKNVWKTRNAIKTVRTKKINKPVIVVPASDKFQAQGQLVPEDIPVGEFVKTARTGRFSPLQKSDILAKMDVIIAAVKKARARANDTPIENVTIGKKIVDFILG